MPLCHRICVCSVLKAVVADSPDVWLWNMPLCCFLTGTMRYRAKEGFELSFLHIKEHVVETEIPQP